MKLTVKVPLIVVTDVEVEFPCYSHFGGDDYDVYRRLDADGTMFVIHDNHDGYEFSTEKHDISNLQWPEESLGLEHCKSTAEAFANVLRQAKAFTERF